MSALPRFALLASLVAASLTLPAVAVEAPASPVGVTAVTLSQQAPIHWVSVAQIARSLDGLPPMAVGGVGKARRRRTLDVLTVQSGEPAREV